MDEVATWHGGRPRPGHIVLDRDPAPPPPPQKGHSSPVFLAHVYCGHGRPSQLMLSSCYISGNGNECSLQVSYLFIMAALHSRCRHYICALWFLLSIFLFFPRLISLSQIGCLPYLHTWCGHSADLGCSSETCCMQITGNAGCKIAKKIAIWAPSHNFVGPCLRN